MVSKLAIQKWFCALCNNFQKKEGQYYFSNASYTASYLHEILVIGYQSVSNDIFKIQNP